ncbi:hypothetical protein [Variovorax sp. WS11]|uniref:hypothetical protein n=1 Tax=Variovorax sp. WS11 TaxID=1105204 RepID=UPI0011B1C7D8|nr:hypothetical protein [Variovorax sp. WS11]NDZ16990.1 hypothetical protein [Variovorax sp. WS11]
MEHGAARLRDELIHSFLALRKAVGFIGTALPFAMLLVHGGGLGSVSEGYCTAGSALFVAGICAIGTFLLFYRGYDARDRIASFVAGGAALVVGQVPCACGKDVGPEFIWGWGPSYAASAWPTIHLLAAAVLFCILALFCLWLFPMSDAPPRANRQKDQRNLTYYVCGSVIAGCLLALFVHFAFVRWLGPAGMFWLETLMLLAFGISWAVKGEAIAFLNDGGAAALTLGASRRPT